MAIGIDVDAYRDELGAGGAPRAGAAAAAIDFLIGPSAVRGAAGGPYLANILSPWPSCTRRRSPRSGCAPAPPPPTRPVRPRCRSRRTSWWPDLSTYGARAGRRGTTGPLHPCREPRRRTPCRPRRPPPCGPRRRCGPVRGDHPRGGPRGEPSAHCRDMGEGTSVDPGVDASAPRRSAPSPDGGSQGRTALPPPRAPAPWTPVVNRLDVPRAPPAAA